MTKKNDEYLLGTINKPSIEKILQEGNRRSELTPYIY